jgi:phosphoglycerol transferase MdoB-like AlkP superfamily enzyme
VAAQPNTADWRTSPLADPHPERARGEDLTRFKDAAKGRNVVMILLESAGAQYLKPYGAAEDPMPNLTALSQKAILFENANAVYPESIKGLFSVLCSRYPAFDTKAETHARVNTPSIATKLAKVGYRTALFHSGRFGYLGMDAIVNGRGFQTLEDAGHIGGNFNSSFGVEDKATVRRMLQWIDSAPQTERFFITYLPVAGHHPYDAPEPGPFPAHDETGRYRNALHYGDSALGEFLEGLKARGLFGETLFVIFGDHSEAFGQHEGNYGHTLFIYEENVRVPFLIVAPGLVRETIRVPRVASLIDSTPTILDLLGLPASPEFQGTSLLEARACMALFYTDYSLGLLGLRDGNWKLIYELESGRAKLFDPSRDPGESRNLAADQPERVRAYQEHVKKWVAAQRSQILRPREWVATTGHRS